MLTLRSAHLTTAALVLAALSACSPRTLNATFPTGDDAAADANDAADPTDAAADAATDAPPDAATDAAPDGSELDAAVDRPPLADGPDDVAAPDVARLDAPSDAPVSDGPATCRSDRECSALGRVCDTGRGVCVDCTRSTDCPSGQACRDNACVVQTCVPGSASCASDTTRRTCGADGRTLTDSPCPASPNSAPRCVGGACTLACVPGFADCNMVAADGCEANTATSGANCGRCGVACGFGGSCVAGVCVAAGCGPGLTRCGGACASLMTDSNNCGICGRSCMSAQTCVGGTCTVVTAPPPLRFSLTWSRTADFDISVVTPAGNVINYARVMADGGALDGDSMATGPENVTWAAAPPRGTYTVCAIPYALTASTAATLTVYDHGASVGAYTRTQSMAAPSGTMCSRTSPYVITTYVVP